MYAEKKRRMPVRYLETVVKMLTAVKEIPGKCIKGIFFPL